jgi:CxxC-x17-CxxC domain-containing protein
MEPDRKMFKGICFQCGENCEVPFEPVENRPFKCKRCFFESKKRRFKARRRDYEVICYVCGKQTTVPFKPVQGKPVLCRVCFLKDKKS